MAYTSWRGVVGVINPTKRPGGTEEVVRLLPEGIGLIPLFLDVREGTAKEFREAINDYEPHVVELAEQEVDLILPLGTPPFMMLGYKGEAEFIRKWERRFSTPIFTSGQNHVRALRALNAKKIFNAAYTTWDENNTVVRYFTDAGFTVLARERVVDMPFDRLGELSTEQIYSGIKKAFLKLKGVDAIYMQGSGWRSLDVIELLEQDLGVPVVQAVAARCWEIQRRLNVRQPVKGFGRLLSEMPD
jgi:maleate isomerase